QAFCSGQRHPVDLNGTPLGTQKEGCDYGANAIGAPRGCTLNNTCTQGTPGVVNGGTCFFDNTNFVCDPTGYGSCTVYRYDNNKYYYCPCAGNACTTNFALCTPM